MVTVRWMLFRGKTTIFKCETFRETVFEKIGYYDLKRKAKQRKNGIRIIYIKEKETT